MSVADVIAARVRQNLVKDMDSLPSEAVATLSAIISEDYTEAEACIQRCEAVGIAPFIVTTLRGAIRLMQKKWREAYPFFAEAHTLQPSDPLALLNLGILLYELGQYTDAVVAYRACLHRDRDLAKGWLKLGAAHMMSQAENEAMACYAMGLRLAPNDAECQIGGAVIQSILGYDANSAAHYRRALELTPDYPEAETGLGFIYLRMGDYARGWPHYEARWRLKPAVALETYGGRALWRGKPSELAGKHILLRGEQGFGDSIQFARYIPLVQAAGATVTLQAAPPLQRLFSNLCPLAEPREVPDFDIQTSLMTLPFVFGTMPETIPPVIDYFVDPADIAIWRERLTGQPGLKVGVCWHGGSRPEMPQANAVDKRRSIRTDVFAPLTHVPGVLAISLQLEDIPASREDMPLADFADTAALITNLDLVITVDTAVAHVAASLGKPTWLLNRLDSCWRWTLQGATSKWYPSIKIYRQKFIGDWDSVISEVRSDLENLVGTSNHTAVEERI